MSTFKNSGAIIIVLAIVASLGAGFFFGTLFSNRGGVGGTVNGPNIENYVPAIQYNRGYKSAFPIFTTSSTTVGSLLDVSGVARFHENVVFTFATSSSSGVAALGIGTTTPQSNAQIAVSSTGTTTLSLTSTGGATGIKIVGSCIQMLSTTNAAGTNATTTIRIYPTASSTNAQNSFFTLRVEAGTCQ